MADFLFSILEGFNIYIDQIKKIRIKLGISYLKDSEHGIDKVVEIGSGLLVVVIIEHIHACVVELAAEELHAEQREDDDEETQEEQQAGNGTH